MSLGPRINDAILALVTLEHRIDPLFRDTFNALFQRPLVNVVQSLLRVFHANPETRLCQEIVTADEEQLALTITEEMKRFTVSEYTGRIAQRAGNTKTYGVVRATFEVRPDVPDRFRHGFFAAPATYPAWIRFAGPGPLSPPDVADAGILSIGIKVMGVSGEKLLPDEQHTQDFTGISCPTFTTPNTRENVTLQREVYSRTPVFYFLNPFDSHYLDAAMQSLYARMNRSPLEVSYWSCVPYLCGEGQAVKYSVRPTLAHKTPIPFSPPDNWLRQSLAMRLDAESVALDFLIQPQTDPRRMPIEDASIEWSERASPFVPVAKITIPRQKFDSPEQLAFASFLSLNPWHTTAEHRPLGNQNRARKLIYTQLSALRQQMNHTPHIEPTGAESFPGNPPLSS
ncbi:catalase family protein [Paracidobacterium acidisoli]|uniref:Catalase n=1 Tax=Paracidobacterium acidisoli TaxID=2303751 RepID=A0A372INI4_9BACT|nr:catalase family protein [Paracidobacterium acidisoli]MBT9332114.1 catalase family protein [Paracidobacterium acidisoli]